MTIFDYYRCKDCNQKHSIVTIFTYWQCCYLNLSRMDYRTTFYAINSGVWSAVCARGFTLPSRWSQCRASRILSTKGCHRSRVARTVCSQHSQILAIAGAFPPWAFNRTMWLRSRVRWGTWVANRSSLNVRSSSSFKTTRTGAGILFQWRGFSILNLSLAHLLILISCTYQDKLLIHE